MNDANPSQRLEMMFHEPTSNGAYGIPYRPWSIKNEGAEQGHGAEVSKAYTGLIGKVDEEDEGSSLDLTENTPNDNPLGLALNTPEGTTSPKMRSLKTRSLRKKSMSTRSLRMRTQKTRTREIPRKAMLQRCAK